MKGQRRKYTYFCDMAKMCNRNFILKGYVDSFSIQSDVDSGTKLSILSVQSYNSCSDLQCILFLKNDSTTPNIVRRTSL